MKLLNDILLENNKFSLKRVISVITFIYVINLASYVTIYNKPSGILEGLLIFLTTILGISTVDKKFTDKNE